MKSITAWENQSLKVEVYILRCERGGIYDWLWKAIKNGIDGPGERVDAIVEHTTQISFPGPTYIVRYILDRMLDTVPREIALVEVIED